MDYSETNDPTTPIKDAMFLDGPPDDIDFVRSGYVVSRIRELNIKTSNTNLKAQSLPYVEDAREDVAVCSPACQRTRLEVSASPPVGHSYPGLRVYDDHMDDNGIALEVAAMSSHKFNVKPSLRVSKSSNSVAMHSPTRGPDRFRNSQKSNESVVNRADDARSGVRSPMRSRANLRASLPPFQTVREVLDSSKKEQQDALDMFDMYGVSRPEGWHSRESERQQATGMKSVQICHSCGGYLHRRARCARCGHEFCVKCKTELVSSLSTSAEAQRERESGEQISKQGAWGRGITHSRSAANLSEPVLDRARVMLSQIISPVAGFLSLRRNVKHISNFAMIAGSVWRNPTARFSILSSITSQSVRQPIAQNDTGDGAAYKSRSKNSFEVPPRRREADGRAMLTSSLSSGYTTAEPVQKPEREVMSEKRPTAPSSRSNNRGTWHDHATRQRLPGPASGSTAHAQQTTEEDTFWIGSEQAGTPQRRKVPQPAECDHQIIPRLTLEGKELESEPPRDFRFVEQTKNTREQQPQVRAPKDRGSPARRADNPTPEPGERSGGKTLDSRDSVRATSRGKSPQQTIESSDPSTWKQQLRKLDDTPASRDGSPRKDHTVSSPDLERRLRQFQAADTNDESFSGSPARSKIDSGKKMASGIPDGDSEMPISHHICEWRTRYMGLSSAFDKLKVCGMRTKEAARGLTILATELSVMM
ncbi:hypothetical protein TgHK011_002047 [Trichoderma gracile]|nr:hypothetical protein TgHK011_002047 [Trichoderma gracile]